MLSTDSASSAIPSISEPRAHTQSGAQPPSPSLSAESMPTPVLEDDAPALRERLSRPTRPKLGSRQTSGTMIISRDAAHVVMYDEQYESGDCRAMSPRRSSEEVDRLEEAARLDLTEQARMLQNSLQAIVDRVESVKFEHEKLEGGNKFLQSYIGELMQTSKITSSAPKKGKGRSGK